MKRIEFDSKLLPDGHLFIPNEYKKYKDADIKVIITIDDKSYTANDEDIELSAVNDVAYDFLNQKELSYYMNLKDYE